MTRLAVAALLFLCLCVVPAAANADAAWNCGASAGWVAAGGQRVDAPRIGGEPCPTAQADAGAASGAPGSLAASGSDSTDGGTSSQTTDARQPRAGVQAQSLAIRNADGKFSLTASKLSAEATGSCDQNRQPTFSSSGAPGTVTLNGRTIDTSRDYSEPGIGANGAPLFGKITIHFNELAKTDTGISRRAIHVVITDRNGAVVFEAVAGEVSAGRSGPVCDPPPVCPAGQEPREGHCVDVTLTPLPPPPPATPPLPPGSPVTPGVPPKQPQKPGKGPRRHRGCVNANATAGQVSTKALAHTTLCLLNATRKAHHLRGFRLSADLSRAAGLHARDMVRRRYFSHTEPDGANVVDRILHSGYLGRYGRWRIGENLGWGWGKGATPRAIVTAWMRSLGHRRNILNRKFHDIGVAVVAGSPRGKRKRSITYVIDFGGFELTH